MSLRAEVDNSLPWPYCNAEEALIACSSAFVLVLIMVLGFLSRSKCVAEFVVRFQSMLTSNFTAWLYNIMQNKYIYVCTGIGWAFTINDVYMYCSLPSILIWSPKDIMTWISEWFPYHTNKWSLIFHSHVLKTPAVPTQSGVRVGRECNIHL